MTTYAQSVEAGNWEPENSTGANQVRPHITPSLADNMYKKIHGTIGKKYTILIKNTK